MNYSELSDFEINKAVGCVTGEANNSEDVFNLVIRNTNGNKFDPCNSWADAGPIIEKSGIGIMPMLMGWRAATERGCRDYTSIANENPLRAAMIVFLMMQEHTCPNFPTVKK